MILRPKLDPLFFKSSIYEFFNFPESLRAHFSQFGEIADLVLKRDKGFGFVTYANPETVDEVLNTYHNIASKEVEFSPESTTFSHFSYYSLPCVNV